SRLRSATITTTHLRFTVRVRTPLALDASSGSAFRGSLFHAIWQRFCTNKQTETCAACPLHETCPVSALVAPLREENAWGQDIPRPYVLLPPLDGARHYAVGETCSFGITLIGSIIQLLPYLMLSIKPFEAAGVGRRLEEHGGQRGQFHVERVESYHPFTGEQHIIYEAGDTKVQVPVITIDARERQQRIEQLHRVRITLRLLTPLCLIDQQRLVNPISFRPLIRRLLERTLALERHYGSTEATMEREERDAIARRAEAVRCVHDETQWTDLRSYSHRQRRTTPIGGLIGKVTFEGELEPFLPLLVLGELIHVGKDVVKGNGWYQIEP
ncbi:MAG: CRISPR system precrRNA processing endoribonuclease RAMP protein Cas6, partial [Ktedonobacteraceae bacterium]|nr:CRISPR system precrRNA processing endoribonuclease RAMP protein Cas6 [Ktedonobacteraceae bacterium]